MYELVPRVGHAVRLGYNCNWVVQRLDGEPIQINQLDRAIPSQQAETGLQVFLTW